jgi:PadR family transcriptional regulator PadR
MMEVLKNLAHRRLVNRYVEKDSPRDRWELTLEGVTVFKM